MKDKVSAKQKMTKSIIVIPTYNEKENISLLIKNIFKILPQICILVVDDTSPDGTGKAVKKIQEKRPNLFLLTNPKKSGLGNAYIEGFKKVIKDNEFDFVIMMDADFSHNPKYLLRLLSQKKKYGLVIGSRYIKGGGITNHWELWRKMLSRLANLYCRIILRHEIKDWTGGFNCIGVHFLKKINFEQLRFSGYAFIISLKYLLIKAGAKYKEVPIFFEERRGGESKISSGIIQEGIFAPFRLIFKKYSERGS